MIDSHLCFFLFIDEFFLEVESCVMCFYISNNTKTLYVAKRTEKLTEVSLN